MLIVSLLFLLPFGAAADGLRPPNPQERAVLTRYHDAIQRVLDKFADDNWQQEEDHFFDIDEDVMVSGDRDVPFDIDESMEREYSVRPGSKLFQERYAPVLAKVQAEMDLTMKMGLSESLPSTRLRVQVHFNRANVDLTPQPGKAEVLKLLGPALAYRQEPAKKKNTSVVLLFGNWKAANWDAGHGWYHFHFRRAGRYLSIENVVVQVEGSPERVAELLHTVDWQNVNAALSLQIR